MSFRPCDHACPGCGAKALRWEWAPKGAAFHPQRVRCPCGWVGEKSAITSRRLARARAA